MKRVTTTCLRLKKSNEFIQMGYKIFAVLLVYPKSSQICSSRTLFILLISLFLQSIIVVFNILGLFTLTQDVENILRSGGYGIDNLQVPFFFFLFRYLLWKLVSSCNSYSSIESLRDASSTESIFFSLSSAAVLLSISPNND